MSANLVAAASPESTDAAGGEISVAPRAKTTNSELPVNAQAPYIVGNATSEWFDTDHVFTPFLERFPSKCGHGYFFGISNNSFSAGRPRMAMAFLRSCSARFN